MKIQTISTGAGTGKDGRILRKDINAHQKAEKLFILRAIETALRAGLNPTGEWGQIQTQFIRVGDKIVVDQDNRWEIVVQRRGADYDDKQKRRAICSEKGHMPEKDRGLWCVKCNTTLKRNGR